MEKANTLMILMILFVPSCDYYHPPLLCKKEPITTEKARAIGDRKVQEILGKQKETNSMRLLEPKISSTKDVPWIMDYDVSELDQNVIRVTIDSCGGIEVSLDKRSGSE